MGRHRIEDQFKEKLAQREITPTAGSWEKLSGKLNSQEKKKGFSLWWIGIAATFLGNIFIAGLVYNTNLEVDKPGLVETPVKEIIKDDEQEPLVEKSLAIEKEAVNVSEKKDGPLLLKNPKEPQIVKNLPEAPMIAEVVTESLIEEDRENNLGHRKNEEISQKLEEIIAEVSFKEGDANNPTNEEIDALLYKAASEISLERKNINSGGTVDAGDLLFAVEMELEESFREKVFDILKEGYLKARTAVANRNYP